MNEPHDNPVEPSEEPIDCTIARTMNVVGGPLPEAPPPSSERLTIPGYQLLERIGSGGYGEVWRALAPGGLEKAVKIVYGTVDDTRAATELKSLERVKHARHPFLLVLERFEIIEGKLIAVTELAEGSLKDRFDEYRQAGKPGIPRTELLKFTRDAADALDFMFDKHGLVHLDVKPENILLVGEHAKVADFGLTQCLNDENLSGLGGLTPQFAAPEVFEGRPSRFSDQYSLAILYQLLLTGQSPFNGRTAAQLTAQHMHSAPVLSPLPPSDRPAIARALSKNPSQRFGSCVEMVEALLERPSSKVTKSVRPSRRYTTQMTVPTDDVEAQIALRFGTSPPPAVQDHHLPTAEPSSAPATRSSLVIGLGGLGGRVIRELNGLNRLDRRDSLVSFLYFDTDASAVNDVGGSCPNNSVSAVSIPLRSASHYRRDAKRWLEWIDRRWLYNIPRSLRTEGIRALGRLACVDHESLVRERIMHALRDLPANEDGEPHVVYLVGSTSGGTASGALLDVTHTLWSVAEELDCRIDVRAALAHVGKRGETNSGVGVANTVSLLTELRQLQADRQSQSAADLEAPPIGFSEVLFTAAGDALTGGGRGDTARRIAAMLRHTLSSPARAVLDADRELIRRRGLGCAVSTFGTAPLGEVQENQVTEFAQRLQRDLRTLWLTRPRDGHVPGRQLVEEVLGRTGLATDRLPELVRTLSSGEAASALEASVRESAGKRSADFVEQVQRAVLSDDDASPSGVASRELLTGVRQLVERAGREVFEHVAKSAAKVVSEPGRRFGSAMDTLATLRAGLVESLERMPLEIESQRKAQEELRTTVLSKSKLRDAAAGEFVRGCLAVRVAEVVLEVLTNVESQLAALVARVEGMRDAFARTDNSNTEQAGELCDRKLLDALDRHVQRDLQSQNLLFGPACAAEPDRVAESLRQCARLLAIEVAVHGSTRSRGAKETLEAAFEQALPQPRLHGVARRFVALPSAGLADVFDQQAKSAGIEATVVADVASDPSVIQVTGGVPFAHVVRELVGMRADVLALADRLHTRVDVNWRA